MSEAVIVGCCNVIADEAGRYLLVRESKESSRRRYNLPAGKPEVGEPLSTAAVREAHEETGLTVRVERLVGVWHCPRTSEGFGVVNFVFASTVEGGKPTPSDEHPEVAFFTRDEIDGLAHQRLLRGMHIVQALDAYERGDSVADVTTVPASPLPE
jgi:ADP-ribose pyrophosphatase YjhB (NUDIX family)